MPEGDDSSRGAAGSASTGARRPSARRLAYPATFLALLAGCGASAARSDTPDGSADGGSALPDAQLADGQGGDARGDSGRADATTADAPGTDAGDASLPEAGDDGGDGDGGRSDASPDAPTVEAGRDGGGACVSLALPFVPWPELPFGEIVARGDFNGDGRPDVFVDGNQGTYGCYGDVAVLLGRGDGTFLTATSPGTPMPCASALVVADFNEDGHADVAGSYSGGTTDLYVLLGHGDGTFAAPLSLAAGAFSPGLASADFDGDGHADLAVLSPVDDAVEVLLGHGDGTFATPVPFAAGVGPAVVGAGDFDGDGRIDLVVGASGSASVLIGDGHGAFAAPLVSAGISAPRGLALADFDADGRLDVSLVSTSEAAVLRGLGNGKLGAPASRPSSSGFFGDVMAADFTGDGAPDLAIYAAPYASAAVTTVLPGRGDGTLLAGVATLTPSVVTALDLDGDGRLDLAGPRSAVLGNGDGTFRTAPFDAVAGGPIWLVSGDFDGSGTLDLAVATSTTTGVSLLSGRGDGTFAPAGTWSAASAPRFAAAGDLNRDGRLDLLLADGSALGILLGASGGGFGVPSSLPLTGGVEQLATGDLDADGNLDVVTASSGGLAVLRGKGDGTFFAATAYPLAGSSPAVVIADLDGDGKPDLVGATSSSYADASIEWLRGRGDGTFDAPLAIGGGPGVVDELAATDLNADGRVDLVVRVGPCTLGGCGPGVGVLLGRGNGTMRPMVQYAPAITASGPVAVALALGDFDGDGAVDVATADLGVGTVLVRRGKGDGALGPEVAFGAGDRPAVLAAGDFNRDGRTDLAALDSRGGGVSVLLATCLP